MSPAMEAAVERLVASAEEQGFGRYVTDTAALATIATQLVDVDLPEVQT